MSLAARAIWRAKLRAALTILGILIGVAAVVLVSALGTGVRAKIAEQILSLGSNTIYVFPQANQTSGARGRPGAGGRLTEADGRAIAREAPSVLAVVPLSSASALVVAADKNVSTTIYGSTRGYFAVRQFEIDDGGIWSDSDEAVKARVCVLGATTRERLFGGADAVGQFVRVGRHAYRVLGVLARKGQSVGGDDQDDRIIMPIGTFRARVSPTAPGRVQMLMASGRDPRTVERAVDQIDTILRQRHGIGPDREPDFGVRTQAEFLKMQADIFDTLQLLLVGIALVSLFVGGIGVMNIMLVSVTERTREIGIRMAIGARENDILIQFLVEAVALCMLGGIAGTALGLGGIAALARALGWSMTLPTDALVLALGTSFGVGVVFGFLPARSAARLDPIDALRHE
jgi:putative ABC transport system permease protein